MASATYSYAWQGIHAESVQKEIDPTMDMAIAQEPTVQGGASGNIIVMSITLTTAVGNPPREDLDSAMRERGWRPI